MNILTPGLTVQHFMHSPWVRPAVLRFRRTQFLSDVGMGNYFGVFKTFDEARAWLPQNKGFDCEDLASEYVNVRTQRVFEYDYPVMWRIDRFLRTASMRILDIGGSVGVHYYAYRPYLEGVERASWHVVEVPTMVRIGSALARHNKADMLQFTDDLASALVERFDIWLAAGALQYMEFGRPEQLLDRTSNRPLHILLNKLPLYEGADFVTTQNLGGGCFSPLHVYNRAAFIERVEAFGYSLQDEWPIHERALLLPGHPQRSFPTFTGLYFQDRRH